MKYESVQWRISCIMCYTSTNETVKYALYYDLFISSTIITNKADPKAAKFLSKAIDLVNRYMLFANSEREGGTFA